jgi:hypothetical protein
VRKFLNICLLLLLAFGSSQAGTCQFDNSDGERLFSGFSNWLSVSGFPVGTYPVTNDTLLLAPALIDPAWSLAGGNTVFAGPGTANHGFATVGVMCL